MVLDVLVHIFIASASDYWLRVLEDHRTHSLLYGHQ